MQPKFEALVMPLLFLGEGDYESFVETVVFDVTTSQRCVDVVPLIDGVYELTENFTVIFMSRDSAVIKLNTSISESFITITDSDRGI